MKKKSILCIAIVTIMTLFMVVMVGCGSNSEDSGSNDTEQTMTAADPQNDGNQSDDSEGCIDDSEDLLY